MKVLLRQFSTIGKDNSRKFVGGFKSTIPQSITRKEFLNREMKENPEFFKAFPHLQGPLRKDKEGELPNREYMNDATSATLFEQSELKSKSHQEGYFQSLLHQHDNYMMPDGETEEMIRENEMNYVSAYNSTSGPIKYMSEDHKEKVHQELDVRLQELEDTGLTRDEILFEQLNKGLRLADDPFFQFIKNSRTAREMLLKPGDEFTADRVVELALRQDVQPDPSAAMNRENYTLKTLEGADQDWEYKKKYRDNTPQLNPSAYFADHDVANRRKRYFDFDQEKPATFINRPLTRNQLRKKHMRPITKKDIDYKNLPMMVKFLNDIGKLYNRYQTRLETRVQRKVAKTIKKMRHQFLLPMVGVIKPTDKIALGSYIEDIEEMHKKTIDPVTGRLFMKYSLQDDLQAKLKREKERFEERFGHIETEEQIAQIEKDAEEEYRIIREMSIDNHQVLPSETTRHWMVAQSHLIMEDADLLEDLSEHERISKAADPDHTVRFQPPTDVERARAKAAYDEISEVIEQRDLTSDNLIEDLLSERAFKLDRFIESEQKTLQDDLLDFVNEVNDEDSQEDLEIKMEIQRIMEEYARPVAKSSSSYNIHEDMGTMAAETAEPQI